MDRHILDQIENLPLDEWNGSDGEDLKLVNGPLPPTPAEIAEFGKTEVEFLAAEQSDSPLTATPKVVPLKRNIHLGTVGDDAFAVKRALATAGLRKWGDWGTHPKIFGRQAVRELKHFQRAHGLKADGVYGPATHHVMKKYFDSWGAYLMGQVKVIPTSSKKRAGIVAAALYGYHNNAAIHYTQSSFRMYGVRNHVRPPMIPRWEDCSSFATWCYWLAGAPDPNGLRYSGFGFTGTQIQHGRRINPSSMRPGDLVFYGWHTIPSHVAIAIGNGLVISHGSEIGPLLLRYNYRSDIHSVRTYL
jgi:hypothetical protein